MPKRFWKRLLLLGFVFIFALPVHSFASKNVTFDNDGPTISQAKKAKKVKASKSKSSTIRNIRGKDVGNYGDGRDLEIHFNVARDKSTFDHYRIFVVKTSKADDFDLEVASKVRSGYYTIAPKGKNIRTTLANYAVDTDGSLIQNDISYTIFVMSVSGNSKKSADVLSKSFFDITLTQKNSSTTNVAAVNNLKVYDINNYGDGRDLQVTFSKAADESNLLEYRVIVVRSALARTFNLAAAQITNFYTVVPKTGADLSKVLTYTSTDSEGNLLKNGVNYKVFVLSVGKSDFVNALSLPSSEIILVNNLAAIKVMNVTAKDVSNYGDGRDLQIGFTIPRLESNVVEYRIMVVPSSQASNFNLWDANNVNWYNYTVFDKTGSNIVTTLPSAARDVNGLLIANNKSYRVFVLSVGQVANELSAASSSVTLTENTTTMPATNVSVADISNWGDGRDMQIKFNKAADESTVAWYKIFVVRSSEASSFDLSKANLVDAANYTAVGKTGSNITQRLSSSAMDINGNNITVDVSYKVFVMTVSNFGTTAKNALSLPSERIILE